MPEIKIRNITKGSFKTMDRAAVAGEHMRQAYIRTKDQAEQETSAGENSPEEYAADGISSGTDVLTYGAVHLLERSGREVVKIVKENVPSSQEPRVQYKATRPKRTAARNVERKATNAADHLNSVPSGQANGFSPDVSLSVGNTHSEPAAVNTPKYGRRHMRPTEKSAATAAKEMPHTIKAAGRTIKIARQTANTEVTEVAVQKSTVATEKAAQRAAQAAKAAAQKAAEATKQRRGLSPLQSGRLLRKQRH